MSSTVLISCLVVGLANYFFRYFPLHRVKTTVSQSRGNGPLAQVLDCIGVASICALLVVSSVPEIMQHPHKFWPTLAGLLSLILSFWRTRSIVISTLAGALVYGLIVKLMLT
ncbi:L-valine transporter subunit YgaH [Biostraticola tofi]|uniref:Branched-subunit amino acid transport protein AzlD n=1 Tax=Biostraticola tofi TaxID=466109 RepID=A0A4R3YPH2_9GAMM|nr:L-valine transporter subunit YgaH [Biostraticola tofi]TCV93064.1 branched-subunit amino acid transport protein AzlD [Biostraticola tofi]